MNKVNIFLRKLLLILTILFTSICAAAVLVNNHKFNLQDGFLASNRLLFAVAVIIFAAFLLIGILCFRQKIENLSEKGLRICAIVLFAVLALGMIISMTVFRSYPPTTDSDVTLNEALALAKGEESQVDQSAFYFSIYKNNNLFTLMHVPIFKLMLALGVTDFLLPFTIINALIVYASHIFAYFSAKRLFGGKNAVTMLLICVLNPALYIFIHFIYTNTYSLLPMMIIVWLFSLMKGEQRKSRIAIYSSIIGAVGVFGYYIRPTSVFPIIAAVVCAILHIIGSGEQFKILLKKYACAGLAFVLTFGVCFVGANLAMKPFVKDSSKNLPTIHWIAMSFYGDGGYNAEFRNNMVRQKNTEEMKKYAVETLKETIKEKGVLGIGKHMVYKLAATWSDGSFAYSNRLTKSSSSSSIYDYVAGEKRNFAMLYSQALRFAMFVLILIALISLLKKRKSAMLPFAVTLLGAMAFYMIWEIKSEYALPFIFILAILSAGGADSAVGLLNKMPRSTYSKTLNATTVTACIMAVVSIGLIVQQYDVHVNKTYAFNRYSVNVIQTYQDKYPKIYENGVTIEQEFYTNKPFNRIEFAAVKLNDSNAKYSVSLCDGSKNVIHTKTVTANEINKDYRLPVYFDYVIPKGTQRYFLRIGKYDNANEQTPTKDSMAVKHRRSFGFGSIDGECTVNGKTAPDILMNVTGRYTSSYYSAVIYLLFAAAIIAFEAAIVFLLIKGRFRKND